MTLAGFREIFDNESLLVEAVCERFFREHPDYNERFRQICREDMAHNIRYLACSVESGGFDLFHFYLLWLRELLEKRDIPVQHLTESLALMREELEPWLQEEVLATTRDYLERGMELLEMPWSEIPATETEPELKEPAARYLDRILAGDRHGADQFISELSAQGLGYVDLIVDVIQPAVAEQRHQRRPGTPGHCHHP